MKIKKRRRLPETIAMEMLASRGFQVGRVETTKGPTIRSDLFGFADLLAVHDELAAPTLAVQVCRGSDPGRGGGDVATRLEKMLTDRAAEVRRCLRAGWRVEVWGIRRTLGPDGTLLDARTLWLGQDRHALHHCEGSLTLLHLMEIVRCLPL